MDPCKPLPEQLLRQSSSAPVCKDSFRTLLVNNLPKGDQKEIDSEFKKTLVLAYQKPKLLKNKPFRKTKKPLTAKEKRSLGLYRLPRKGLKYSSFVSLHSLWSGYMTELLDLQALEDGGWTPNLNEETRQLQLQMRVCRADLTGALVTVATAACPSHVGATGLVVMETKNTLQIISLDDKLRWVLNLICSLQVSPKFDIGPLIQKADGILNFTSSTLSNSLCTYGANIAVYLIYSSFDMDHGLEQHHEITILQAHS